MSLSPDTLRRIRDPYRWMVEERFVTWVIVWNDFVCLVTKIHDHSSTEVTIESSDQSVKSSRILKKYPMKENTPEALLEVINREVPLLLVESIHSA